MLDDGLLCLLPNLLHLYMLVRLVRLVVPIEGVIVQDTRKRLKVAP